MSDNPKKTEIGRIHVASFKMVKRNDGTFTAVKKLNKNTQGHATTLRAMGYTVRDEIYEHRPENGKNWADYIEVECTGFVTPTIDTTVEGDEANDELVKLVDIIKAKKMISYPSKEGTQIIFKGSDGELNDGVASKMPSAVGYLDRLLKGGSALVAKRASSTSKKKAVAATFELSDVLGALNSEDDDAE